LNGRILVLLYSSNHIYLPNSLDPERPINCILTVQHGYKVAEIDRIVLELELELEPALEPVPSPGHEHGLAPPEQQLPWSLGCTFGVAGTDLGGHVGEVGSVVRGGIAGPDGHEGVES